MLHPPQNPVAFWAVYSVAAVIMIVSIWMHLALCLTRANSPSMQSGLVNCSQRTVVSFIQAITAQAQGMAMMKSSMSIYLVSLLMYSHWYLPSIALRVKRLRKLPMRFVVSLMPAIIAKWLAITYQPKAVIPR